MIKGIYNASQSLHVRDKNMAIIANNLANLNSTGFKRKVPFSEVMTSEENQKLKQVIDFRQGDFVNTENKLDLAINGEEVFFAIKTEDGVRFTRNGKFDLTDEGVIVDELGDPLMGKSGEINLKANMLNEDQVIHINRKGEIRVGDTLVDTISLAKVEEPQKFKNDGYGRFEIEGEEYEQADVEDYEIAQGYLEASNVSAITEMEAMISINTDYTSSQRMVNYLDKSLQQANQIGKV